MRTLKGIMINGEWLGAKVLINSLFRTICNISPLIMQEFIKLINDIERLDEVVTIENFSFSSNKNSINIDFKNQKMKGLATLSFKKENGILFLNDKFVEIFDENKGVEQNNVQMDEISESHSYIKNEEDVSFDKQKKEENLPEEFVENFEIAEENSDLSIDKINDDEMLEENEDVVNAESITTTVVEKAAAAEAVAAAAEEEEEEEEEEVQCDSLDIDTNLTKGLMDVSIQQIKPIQFVVTTSMNSQDYKNGNNLINTDKQEADEVLKNQPVDEIIDECIETELKVDDKKEFIESDKIDDINVQNNDDEQKNILQKTKDTFDILNKNLDEKLDLVEKNDLEGSFLAQEELPANYNSDINEEEIENCLSDFYDTTNFVREETAENLVNDNIVVQAVMAEMLSLREELNKIKEETQKSPIISLSGKRNYVDDEDADFRIMGDGERVNASVLDEDLFIAGDKLYRWGDTLYLED